MKKNLGHNSKKDFLNKPVEHIDITKFDARPIISSMEKMSFVSRETANAAKIFNEMLSEKDCTIFLTLAGSTSAAGCMHIYRDLVKYNMVDAIVATGASIIDMDFFEALGFKHYQGSQFQDDTELRKKQKLYINDGTYGTLFDGGVPNIVYPSRLITNGRMISKKMTAFDFYGPTCDSMDYMKGPFILPNNIKENDYIELGQLGAYGLTFRTQFNGFYSDKIFEVDDEPVMTMYDKDKSKSYLVA